MLILTDWKEFGSLDLVRLNQAVRFPIVIDGRNLYSPPRMQEAGFIYYSIGRKTVRPEVLAAAKATIAQEILTAILIHKKLEREAAVDALKDKMSAALKAKFSDVTDFEINESM